MSFLYQKTFTTVDAATGEKVTRKRKKWRIRYRDADGVMQDVPGFDDKAATKQLAAELERKVARQRVGLIDRFDAHLGRPLSEHLDDFEAHLHAKGNTEKHVRLKVQRIGDAIAACNFDRITDLVPSRLETWLADRRRGGLSHQSSNHYLTVMKSFTRWLIAERRMPDDPFVGLRGVNVKLDPRHQRRVLALKELKKILKAAENGKPFRGISGPDRAMLYRVALCTGLRVSELASLTPASFDLDAKQPTVKVAAGYSKRRSEDEQTLRADLTRQLKTWLKGRPDDAPLWPGTWKTKAAVMLRKDLTDAGIAYRDPARRVFDFHAMRHQFISNLAEAGVHPKVAQELARHSDINLTLSRYSHTSREVERAAVEAMVGLG